MTPDIEALCARLEQGAQTYIGYGETPNPVWLEAAAALREQAVLVKALEQRCQEWSDENEKIEDERDALQARVRELEGQVAEAREYAMRCQQAMNDARAARDAAMAGEKAGQ